MSKFIILTGQVEQVRSFFLRCPEGEQCVLKWRNKEIGNHRPDLLSPAYGEMGEPYLNPPHWAYAGEPEKLFPSDIDVSTRVYLPVPSSFSSESGKLYARVKREYWGGFTLVSERKAKQAMRSLSNETGKQIHYEFQPAGMGMAKLLFYHETIEPFTLE